MRYHDLFDTNKIGILYKNYDEQLQDCLRLVDFILHYACKLQLHGGAAENTLPYYLKGSPVLVSQIENSLQTLHLDQPDFFLSTEEREEILLAWDYLLSRLPEEMNGQPNLLHMLLHFVYTQNHERLCLLLGLCVRLDKKYERIFGFIQDNSNETVPTLAIAYSLSSSFEKVSTLDLIRFVNNNFSFFLIFSSQIQGINTELTLREPVYLKLIGENSVSEELKYITHKIVCSPYLMEDEPLVIRKDTATEISSRYQMAIRQDSPTIVILTGEKGAGKKYLACHVASFAGKDVLQIQMDYLEGYPEKEFTLVVKEIAATCMINGMVPMITYEQSSFNKTTYKKVLEIFYEFNLMFVFTLAREVFYIKETGEYISFNYNFDKLTYTQSQKLWTHYLAREELRLGRDVDINELSSKYKLLPGQITNIVQLVRANSSQEQISEYHITEAVREQYIGMTLKYCKRVRPFFTMDDLILQEDIKDNLSYIIKRMKKENFIHKDWGFDKKYAYGKSTSILLYGKPGTGKSMCAHVIANALELDLLKVDLSSVMSKYVGETEKNLTEVFAEAEKTNAILFFDEADSLFSQRSKEMSGANDKYANLETAHLLQKLEEFSGICVLTTNMAMNFDKAFFRRFEFMLNFPYPDVKTRTILWERSFPAECPVTPFLPYDFIAEKFELSPSDIKSITRNAAFLAACKESEEVTIEHIVEAIRMDFHKNGKAMPMLPF